MIRVEETQNKMGGLYEKSTLRQHIAMHLFTSYILDLIGGHVRLYNLQRWLEKSFTHQSLPHISKKDQATRKCVSFFFPKLIKKHYMSCVG